MAKNPALGDLIKEARTGSKLTQEQLAAKIDGMTSNDISKAERNQMIPSQNQLKQIAKATGVTQKSLLDAAKADAENHSSSGKTTSAGKPSSSVKDSLQLTANEKKLIELYRQADAKKKKEAMSLLKGETQTASDILSSLMDGSKKPDEILTSLLSGKTTGSGSGSQSGKKDDVVNSLLGAFMNMKK